MVCSQVTAPYVLADKPYPPRFLQVVSTEDSASIGWSHDLVCFSDCGILFNLSLYQLLGEEPQHLLSVAIVTLGYNVSNLTSDVWYKVVVVTTCNNTIGITSDPKEAYFITSVVDVHFAGMHKYHIHACDIQYVQYWVCLLNPLMYIDMYGK